MTMRAVIFANGELPDLEKARELLHPNDFLIASNGGTRHILALQRLPSVVVGDLDSITSDERWILEANGIQLIAHSTDKDETDLELAIRYAVEAGYQIILVIAALGGHLDQTLGNLALLTDPDLSSLNLRFDNGIEEVCLITHSTEITGKTGDTISLLPWGRAVKGVVVEGLKWPLQGETLYPHKTRGISNEMLSDVSTIKVRSGLLLCIHRREPG